MELPRPTTSSSINADASSSSSAVVATPPPAVTGTAREDEFRKRLEACIAEHGDTLPTGPPLPTLERASLSPPKLPIRRAEKSPGGGRVVASSSSAAASSSSAPPAVPAQLPAAVKGLSSALLHKVLQRQVVTERLQESAPTLKRAALCVRLPELSSAIRSCLHEDNKRVMRMSELIKKLTISSGGTSTASVKDMQDQMGLLAEVCAAVVHDCDDR